MSESTRFSFFNIKLDELIFQRPSEPDVSVFFVADRVVAEQVRGDVPVDIFRVALPSPPDTTSEEDDEGFMLLGMKVSDVKSRYGAMYLDVNYTFNGQPAEHAIYETHSGRSFTEFTFVGGVLTEFADLGRLPTDPLFQGR